MDGKFLGKITSAEFGLQQDNPLVGLQLKFQFDGGCMVKDGGRYCVNPSPRVVWYDPNGRNNAMARMVDDIVAILKEARVRHVSELVGKPVEIVIDRNLFTEFRILTEVL